MTSADRVIGYAGFGSTFFLGLGFLRAAQESAGLVERFVIRETAFNGQNDPYILLGFGLAFVAGSLVALVTTSR